MIADVGDGCCCGFEECLRGARFEVGDGGWRVSAYGIRVVFEAGLGEGCAEAAKGVNFWIRRGMNDLVDGDEPADRAAR